LGLEPMTARFLLPHLGHLGLSVMGTESFGNLGLVIILTEMRETARVLSPSRFVIAVSGKSVENLDF